MKRQLNVLVYICSLFGSMSTMAFDAGRAAFTVIAGDLPVEYSISHRMVMPSTKLDIRLPPGPSANYQVEADGEFINVTKGRARWQAPETPGHHAIHVTRLHDKAAILIQVFVLEPQSKSQDGRLNGYRMGKYPSPLKGLNSYRKPTGFIKVTAENRHLPVSPHFTLGQFLCKQESGYPKYLLLRPKLLTKLELILETLNDRGHAAESLVVMSGYRTPWYNRSIGNVAHSRHIYGGAADVFVDVNPVNNRMDDLNGDGRADRADAAYLYGIGSGLVKERSRKDLTGGVGEYGSNAAHGPFVHIDVRGSRARWGH